MLESQIQARAIPAGSNGENTSRQSNTRTTRDEQPDAMYQAKVIWQRIFRQQADTVEQDSQSLPQRRPIQLSLRNQRCNTIWGDALGPKPAGTIRIYAQNLNGVTLDKQGGTFNELCRVQKELHIDIFCGQEHNLDTSQPSVRKQLYDITRQHWDRSRLITGTTPIPFSHQYKPGGTMILAAGSVTSRITTQGSDKWGRWVTQEIQGRQGLKLVVISAYQVIYKTGQLGLITAATQQVSLLSRTQDILRNPRDAFIRDLSGIVRKYIQDGVELLLIGDFNETVGSHLDGITSLISKYTLVNLMTSKHSARTPATYARGVKCIDYALATKRFVDALTTCGYESFNHRLHSDHRGYFFDFNTNILLGSQIPEMASRASRSLNSKNLKSVTEYIRRKHKILEDHNVFRRAEKLLTPGLRHEYAERLDQDVLRASIAAETTLTRFAEPEWSRELQNARRIVRILEKWISMKKTGLDQRQMLEGEMAQLDAPISLPQTLQEASHKLQQIKRNVQRIVRTSYTTRDEEIGDQIKELEKSDTLDSRQQIKRLKAIKQAEGKKQIFKKLAALRNTKSRQGVTRIEIPLHPEQDPKVCTEWQTIDIPQDILHLLQERNRKHFGQAHGTPFTIPPLSDQLGYSGSDSQTAEQILNGQYDVDKFAPNVAQLLKHLKQTNEMASHPTCPIVSMEAFKGKIKSWRESTTTSPSGLHLGHYKVLFADHSFSRNMSIRVSDMEEKERLDSMQQDLQILHLSLLNYALQRGYSFRRWQTIANTMLFKDPDNFRLHRTRVIHIYEADFNLALGIKWRSAMHTAEVNRWFNNGQFGSRKRRNAIDPVLVEELQYEISRATRRSVLLTNYDAASCYDRIIPNLAALVSRKFGVHNAVTKSNFVTLRDAEYRVRTDLGLADKGYHHCTEFPIYGTGQGSGNSPAIWCMLSCILFDCYDEKSVPAHYHDFTKSIETSLGLLGFVDDCNGQTNSFSAEDTRTNRETLKTQAQHNAQLWANLLHASGGALELSKCSCHLISWMFTLQGAPVMSPKEKGNNSRFSVIDPMSSASIEIPILSSYQAHKTLGHYKEPAGIQREQVRQLRKLCKENIEFLWMTPVTRHEALTFYKTSFLPAVSYPLSCSAMSSKQLESIQRTTMSIIIARCGYNRHTKRDIIYGPKRLGGADFKSFVNQQGVGQIALLLRHSRLNLVTGKLLRIALSWFQVQVGTTQFLLEDTTTDLPHLESIWIKSIRQFLKSIGGRISLSIPEVNLPQRENDSAIMDIILASRRFAPAEIRRLNYCRLYLQAVTISDLTNVQGDRLDTIKLHGEFSLISSRTIQSFIHQERPSHKEWILWERANRLWSDDNGRLYTPLGAWIRDIDQMHQEHFAYATETTLWVRQAQQFAKCFRLVDDTYQETTTVETRQDISKHAAPVEIIFQPPNIWRIKYWSRYQVTRHPIPPQSLANFFAQLDPWEAELLEHTSLAEDPRSIVVALEQGLVAVSDGSEWSQTQGSFGWALSNNFGERVATGMGLVRGAKQNSYRSEAHGLLSLLCFLIRIAEFTHNNDTWEGHLATDSQSLLDTLFGLKTQTRRASPFNYKNLAELDVMIPEWDVLILIQERLRRLPAVDIQHIKGHQDKYNPYDSLTLLAQLNVDADDMASLFQRTYGSPSPHTNLPTQIGAALHLPQGTVTAHHISALHSAASGPPLMQYMSRKNNWTLETTESINWEAHGSALAACRQKHTHCVKLVHDILPTNYFLYRHSPTKQQCPLCNCIEDRDHIIRCSAPSRAQWRHQFSRELAIFCDTNHTCPNLKYLLLQAIQAWFQGEAQTNVHMTQTLFPDEVRPIFDQQESIGWRQIFNGRFGLKWSQYQERWYSRSGSAVRTKFMTGQRWQISLIKFIWNQWFLLWSTRNQDVHGADEATRRKIERDTVSREVRKLHDLKHQMEPRVQELLPKDMNLHLSQPTRHNKNWLRIHGPTMQESIKRARDLAIKGTKSIRNFFAPIR